MPESTSRCPLLPPSHVPWVSLLPRPVRVPLTIPPVAYDITDGVRETARMSLRSRLRLMTATDVGMIVLAFVSVGLLLYATLGVVCVEERRRFFLNDVTISGELGDWGMWLC